MTSSSTVGTGRRYRLRADLVEALNGELAEKLEPASIVEAVGLVRLAAGIENVVIHVPLALTEPVGLDMAEPDNGTVIKVSFDEGWFVAERDDIAAVRGEENWFCTDGNRRSFAEILALPDVSITVLVPRDDPTSLPLRLGDGSRAERSMLPARAAYLAMAHDTNHLTSGDARALGRALLSAADQYDAEQPDPLRSGPIGIRHRDQADSGD